MTIKFIKLDPHAVIPVYSSEGAAGADIASLEETIIKPGELILIRSGLAIEIPSGYFILMTPRSSLCLKKYLDMPHSVGVFDADYRGEYFIPLRNLGKEDVIIDKGERIAQLILIPYIKAQFNEVEVLSESIRGEGGFGSTGKI